MEEKRRYIESYTDFCLGFGVKIKPIELVFIRGEWLPYFNKKQFKISVLKKLLEKDNWSTPELRFVQDFYLDFDNITIVSDIKQYRNTNTMDLLKIRLEEYFKNNSIDVFLDVEII